MKKPAFLLLSALAISCYADEEIAKNEEVAANKPVAMLKVAKVFGKNEPTDRVSTLESEMKDVYTDTVRGQFGARAASARPQIDSYRLYTAFDALVWKEYQGGDDYAFTDNDGVDATPSIGTNKHLTFDWKWGFRALLGYHFSHDAWDAQARYTWYHGRASNSIGVPIGGTVQPLYPPYSTHVAGSASAQWKTNISILDIEILKSYFLNRYFALSPFMGLKTAWIKQKLNATYNEFPDDGFVTQMNSRNNFWGTGPWTGSTATYYFNSMFNLFGSMGGALMIASINASSHETQTEGGAVTTPIDLSARVTRVTPALQAALGLCWEMNFNCDRNHVAFRFAYEASYWWRQNQTLHFGFSEVAPFRRFSEDLGLHGFSMDLLFDF